MILAFSDIHLGIKSHSTINDEGLFTAEVEARIALNHILNRATKEDIDLLICCGDVFHTSHPTTRNIEFITSWIQQIDKLNKPTYIMTGNHDVSSHSNSLVYLNQLELRNVKLIDSFFLENNDTDEILWNDWKIIFVPYLPFDTSKERNKPTYDKIKEILDNTSENLILVSHVYDSEVTIGSESTMIARFTETIDFDEYKHSNAIMLLGHAHKHQMYVKKNGLKIIYPGSLFFHDLTDRDQEKGYVLIDDAGTAVFERTEGIRSFVSYTVPESENVVEFFKSFRMTPNSLVFVYTVLANRNFNETELRTILKEKGSILDSIRYLKKDKDSDMHISLAQQNTDPYKIFISGTESYYKNKEMSISKEKILERGKFYLESEIIGLKK